MWADGGPYEVWTATLQRWEAGENVDITSLPALSADDFTADHWVRLHNRLSDALGKRLSGWSRGLTAAVAESRDEFGVARALTQARAGLRSIRALAAHPGLPADLTRQVLELVDNTVRSAQRMLEEEVERERRAGRDRSLVEARLRTLRHNALTAVLSETPMASPPVPPDPWLGSNVTRRRVVP